MKKLASLTLAASLFLAGMAVDRYWMKSSVAPRQDLTPSPSSSKPRSEAASGLKDKKGLATWVRLAVSQAAPQRAPVPGEIEFPKNEFHVLETEQEQRLRDIVTNKLPQPPGLSKKLNDDGSQELYGQLDEGKNYWAHVSRNGEITREGWNGDNSENIFRSYYESGGIKLTTWTRPDRSQTTINFTQSGLYENRFDRFADATTYSTNYDEAGQVKEVWRTFKDGKPEKLQ